MCQEHPHDAVELRPPGRVPARTGGEDGGDPLNDPRRPAVFMISCHCNCTIILCHGKVSDYDRKSKKCTDALFDLISEQST